MADQEEAEVREATAEDYLVTRDENGDLEPVEIIYEGRKHLVKPFTYGEATRHYGDAEGVEDIDDEKALEIIRNKFVVPDLSGMESEDDLKPSAVVRLLSVIHLASEINADVEREDGMSKVEFADDEKKTG